MLGWIAIALAVGMLIWVRLRLVTDIPRSAYADPEQRSIENGGAPDQGESPASDSRSARSDASGPNEPR